MTTKDSFILVTGASSGIGYDACRILLENGFKVIGSVRKEEDKKRLESTFSENFEAVLMDVTNNEQIDSLIAYLHNKLKDSGLFGLINSAGIAKGGPLMLVSNEEFTLQMQTNLNSVFRITNGLLPLMGASKNSIYSPGRIINISSVSGLVNTPMLGPYCISKHGLESMSDIYRRELSLYGIKVVLIEPGPINTPIWGKSVPQVNPYVGSDFEKIFISFRKQVENSQKNALPVEKVSKVILKTFTKKNPSNRYIISKTKLLIKILAHLFPSRWLDTIFTGQLQKQLK